MNATTILLAIEVAEGVINSAIRAGLNWERYRALKDANNGEPLTAEQREELLAGSQAGIDRLPDSPEN